MSSLFGSSSEGDPLSATNHNVDPHSVEQTHESSSTLDDLVQAFLKSQGTSQNVIDSAVSSVGDALSTQQANADISPSDPRSNSTSSVGHVSSDDSSDDDQSQSGYGYDNSDEEPVSDDDDDQEFVLKYNFRSKARFVDFDSVWMDQDDSGNYDPSSEIDLLNRPPPGPVPVKRCQHPSDSVSESDGPSPKRHRSGNALSLERARREGIAFIHVFELSKEKCQQLKQAGHEDNWPLQDTWNFLTDDLVEVDQEAPTIGFPVTSWRTTRVQARTRAQQRMLETSEARSSGAREQDEAENLTGHPAGRGCTACHELGVPCPLLDPWESWPCTSCYAEGIDCILRLPPSRKRDCEECYRRGVECSYTVDDSDEAHAKACEQCSRSGRHCIAGPALDPTRVRMMPDGTPARFEPLPARGQKKKKKEQRSCDACLQARKEDKKVKCSYLRTKVDMTKPIKCKRCEENGAECKVGRLNKGSTGALSKEVGKPRQTLTRPRASTAAPDNPNAKALQRPLEEIKADTDNGFLMVITTNYSHPLRFLVGDARACLWCTQPVIAAMGLPSRRVKVIALSDNSGYQEADGGWTSLGVPPMSMCRQCSFQRLRVILCVRHRLCPISASGHEHQQGLKRIRGGIGSSKHDEKQKSISSFFSKRSKQS